MLKQIVISKQGTFLKNAQERLQVDLTLKTMHSIRKKYFNKFAQNQERKMQIQAESK